MSSSLLFNPSQATTEELESTFVGRHALLQRIEEQLVADQSAKTPRHWQIIGPRGCGKSHLTELLARRMAARYRWRIARLPEENYQVGTLGELLEQILVRSLDLSSSPLLTTSDDVSLQERVLDRLRETQRATGRVLLVILENLASMFERQLKSTRDQARLRDILTNNPPFVLVSTSTSQSPATLAHSAPLYEFFHTQVLDDLSQIDITQLVHARADWEGNASLLADFARVKGRVEAIYHLSGGNPRLALALYRVVQNGVTTELHDQIMKLLDEVTPYYQSRLNDIPTQAARVLTEMAVANSVIAPSEIARRCRMPTNQITAHIKKLVDERLVIQGGKPNKRSQLYELKDRLLRIWLQMRESGGGGARRLRFLAEFFERWYANQADELEAFSRRTMSDFWTDLVLGDNRRCVDRLKTLSYLTELRSDLHGSAVLRAMSKQLDESTKTDIRAHVDSLLRTFERTSDLREREVLAILLSECFTALGTEGEAQRFLKRTIDDGSQNASVVARYLSSLVAGGAYREAWSFGDHWRVYNPHHTEIQFPLSIAACGVGQIAVGFKLMEDAIRTRLCQHCTESLLRRVLLVLRETQASPDIELQLWKRFMSDGAREDIRSEDIESVFNILVESQLGNIPPEKFDRAATIWNPLSRAPSWLLGKAICGLAHRGANEARALIFISAIAKHGTKPLSQFAVDHLVEILPALRHEKDRSAADARNYFEAISLVKERTTPQSLSEAFRLSAPYIAKRLRDVVVDLIDLYREWIDQGLLDEPITPYSEAVSVLSSPEPSKVLQSLHPESRDAVMMLIHAMRHRSRAAARPDARTPNGARAGVTQTAGTVGPNR